MFDISCLKWILTNDLKNKFIRTISILNKNIKRWH